MPTDLDILIQRLNRYSKVCLTEKLDLDFAMAVKDAIDYLKCYKTTNVSYKKLVSDLNNCRNELCLKCGEYKMRHKGACDGCRWKDGE